MNGKIIVNLTRNWHPGIPYFRGTMFDGTKKLSPDEAQSAIRVLNDRDAVTSFLKKSNGFFSVVNVEGNNGWIAVDRIRSLPLFYGQHNGKLFISDDARWVREQVQDNEMDPIASEEFLACGYVTGPDTLFPNVKQVQAGEVVFFQPSEDSDIIVEPLRYYRYVHGNYFEDETEILFRKLDETLINVFQNLISYARGRTIVIPLSGGYDSRLVAVMLKRLGYDNMLTLSYGSPDSKESKVSKKVAESLDIPWYFVSYDKNMWWKWFNSEERITYYNMSHNLVSLPHIQDFLAVKDMHDKKVIEPNSVFAPGHTGDFIAGGHIPESFFDKSEIGESLYLDAVIKKHYSLWPFDELEDIIRDELKSRILRMTEAGDLLSPIGAADAIEKWDWQERQAKFIVNSVRVYEFWGYNWWLPLWDAEMMDFWAKIPLELRRGEKFYIEYVTQAYARIAGIDSKMAGRSSNITRTYKLKRMIKRTPLFPLVRAIYKPIRIRHEYHNHPMAWYGIMGDKVDFKVNSINSFLVKELLDNCQ